MAYREIMHMRRPRDMSSTPSKKNRKKNRKKNCVQTAAADQHYALVLRNRRLSQTEAIGHVQTVLNDPTVRRALVSLQLPGALKAHSDRNRAHTLNIVAEAFPSMQRLVSLDLRNNCIKGAAAGKALGDAIAVNTVLKELDLSEQHDMDYTLKLNAAFAKAFAIGLGANRALTSLNISNNNIGQLVLPEGWSEKYGFGAWYGYTHSDGREQKEHPGKPEGVIPLANAISASRALVKFDISNNDIRAEGCKPLAEALKNNRVMTELNISNNTLGWNTHYNSDASGIIAIGDALPTMGALVTINIMGNKIGKTQLSKLQEIMQAHPTLVSLCGIADDATEANMSGIGMYSRYQMNSDDAAVLAGELPAKGALVKLDISNNSINGPSMMQIAGALKDNQKMQELDISRNNEMTDSGADMTGIIAICDVIPTMGALAVLNMSTNRLATKAIGKIIGDMLSKNSVLQELNLADNLNSTFVPEADGHGFAKGVADGLSTNGALVSVNLLNNRIGAEQAQNLVTILKEHATLKFLCGNKGDETMLDMSGKSMGADDAIMLASEIVANGALASVNILKNNIGDQGLQAIEAVFQESKTLKSICGATGLPELDLSSQELRARDAKVVAVELKYNRALASLNISDNNLCQGALKAEPSGRSLGELVRNRWGSKVVHYDTDMTGIIALADGIKNNGALTKLVFGGNTYNSWDNEWITPEPATLEVGMKEADLSNKGLGVEGAIIIGAWISHKENGAFSYETITRESLIAFYQEHSPETQYKVDGIVSKLEDGAPLAVLKKQLQQKFGSVPRVTMVQKKANGALVNLNMSNNHIRGAEAGKALGDALAANTVLEKLDLSGGKRSDEKTIDAEFANAFAVGIRANEALTSLDISNNKINFDINSEEAAALGKTLADALAENTVLKQLDLSNNFLMPSFAKELAIGLGANGAISNVNILSNNIGAEQANDLIKIMESHRNLKTLCGFSGDETELDLSNKNLSAGCGVLVANEIKNNGALTSLDLNGNHIGLLEPPKGWTSEDSDGQAPWIHIDGRRLEHGAPSGSKPEGAIAISEAIRTNGALTTLDIRDNDIAGETLKQIKWVCQVNDITLKY